MARRAGGRVRTLLWSLAVAAVALVALGALGLYLAPRVLPNLESTTSERDVTHTVRDSAASAELTVPAGWVARRGWDDEHALVLRSPDAVLTVTVTLVPRPLTEAFDDEVRASGDGFFGSTADERLASGLDLRHTESADGTLLAVAGAPGSSTSVQLVGRAPAERLDDYRRVLSTLLESVRVGS